MAKYRVYAIATASWLIGTYEAETPEAAEKMADEDDEAIGTASVCHQCSDNLDIGDYYEVDIEEA